MSHVVRNMAASAAMMAAVAGCGGSGSPEHESAPVSETTHTLPSPTVPGREELLENGFSFQEGPDVYVTTLPETNPQLALVQQTVGAAVAEFLLTSEPITVQVDAAESQVDFSLPPESVLRMLIIVPSNADIPGVLGEDATSAQTQQFFEGADFRLGGALGAITQDPEDFLFETGTEYCQTLDMEVVSGEPFSLAENGLNYVQRKEAACNTVGRLADVAFSMYDSPDGYAVYQDVVAGDTLDVPSAEGTTIPYPVLSEAEYDRMNALIQAHLQVAAATES